MMRNFLLFLITLSILSCTKNPIVLQEDYPPKDTPQTVSLTFIIMVSDNDGHNLMNSTDGHNIGKQLFLEYNGKRQQMVYYSYPDSLYRLTKGMELEPVLYNGVYEGKDVLCVSSLFTSSIYLSGEAAFQIIWPDNSVDSLKFFKNEAYLRPNYVLYLNEEAHPFDTLQSPPVLKIKKNITTK